MLRDYLIRNYKEDVESAMATAEDAIKQRFIFNQRWDMERTYVAETFDGETNFMHQPGGDPEWVYAFNRLKHFISPPGYRNHGYSYARNGWVGSCRKVQ